MKLLSLLKELSLHPKNAEELKGLILQLAIQGKLTDKWRADNSIVEPASVLLEKIEEEKALLISQKKIKKEKIVETLSKDEVPFVLPENWEWCKLIEISSINGGFAFKSSNYVDEGARVIRISDFDELGFKNHKVVRHNYTEDLLPYVLEDRNILIAMTGGTVGKSLFVNHVNETMVVNQRVATIKIIQPIFEAYVNCVIPTKLIQDVIEEAKNSTNDNISMSDIKGFNIPIPPLEEQKVIVEVVNALFKEVEALENLTKERISLKEDFVISALRRLTETDNTTQEWNYLQQHFSSFFTEKKNIKSLRETILQLAVQGKLTAKWREENPSVENASELLKRIEAEKQQLIAEKKLKKEKPFPIIEDKDKPYELPESWVWCRLNQLTEVITKGSSPKWQGVQYVEEGDGGILFVTSENVGSYKLLWKKKKYVEAKFNDIEPRSILKRNDLLMNIVGGSIGRTAIYDIDDLANINQAVTIIRLLNECNYTYFLHFFNSPICISYMYDKQVDNARPNLSMGNISKFMMPLPPLKEQQAIVEKVNSLMSLCDKLEQQVDNSQTQVEQLMQSCLKEVFEQESN
ncbi:restriction endonuclease subunit S [Flavicella sp.]|nr:restriction endonuclease subunit S [Flavicella sp.]MDA9111290.1 restriction endonuclease subunit S [Flavicella sp.]